MPINQTAKRVVRAARIAFRAVRILATDRSLPWLLRILFVIGAVQMPFSPVDEVAAIIALAWLLVFHRPALSRAMRAARATPEPKEHTMPARKLIIVSAAALAAVAAAVSLALGAVPAFASSHPHSPLATAVVSAGRMVRMPASNGYPRPDRAVCVRQSPRPGHVPFAAEIGATGLTWQYVTAGEAAYFHVSRCSVAIVAFSRSGQDSDLILTPSGRVVGRT